MTNPDSLSGLVGWWKADAISGLSDGDRVTTWVDSSSEGNDAAEAGANRPTYKTNIINSLPVVRFAGSPEFLDTGTPASLQVTDFSIFVVASADAAGGGPICNYSAGNDSTDFGRGYGATLDENNAGVKKGSGDTSEEILTVTRVDAGTGFTWFDGFYTDSGDLEAYDQAVGESATPDTGGISYTNVVGFLLGKQLARGANTTWFDGDIAEIIIYDRVLTDIERDGIRDYLVGKYFPGIITYERRFLAIDVDDETGERIYTTSWENGLLYLRRWSADRTLLEKTNMGSATSLEVDNRDYWIFPHTPGYFTVSNFGLYVYVVGRWDDGSEHHIALSIDGGATFTDIGDASWAGDRIGAMWTTDASTIYVVLNGAGEIWRTTNAGVSWSMINSGVPFAVEHQALTRHPDGRVLIGSNAAGSPAAQYVDSPYTGSFTNATDSLPTTGTKPAIIWIV